MAGGLGTRLRPLTFKRPKPLVPILGKPVISYILDSFVRGGFTSVVLTTSYMPELIIKGIERPILYSFEKEPLGTAGGVKKVAEFLDDTFLVGSGDVLADVDVEALYRYHKEMGGKATMALTRVEDPSEFGVAVLDDAGRIEQFVEKPKREEAISNLVNAGIYVLEPDVLNLIPEGKEYDFSRDLFPKLLEDIYGFELSGLWIDIGRPGDLLRANRDMALKEGKGKPIISPSSGIKGSAINGPSFIGAESSLIDCQISSSYICKSTKMKGAFLENSLIMDGCSIGEGAKISNSILAEGCKIGDGAIIDEGILGDGIVVLGNSAIKGRVFNLEGK